METGIIGLFFKSLCSFWKYE